MHTKKKRLNRLLINSWTVLKSLFLCLLKKLKPEPEAEGKEKCLENRAEKQERVHLDPLLSAAPSPPTSNTTVTNTADLNDSREINFEYLKHVVLKFMSSREAEVSHHHLDSSRSIRPARTKLLVSPLLGIPADQSCVCAAQLYSGGRGHAEANSGVQGWGCF